MFEYLFNTTLSVSPFIVILILFTYTFTITFLVVLLRSILRILKPLSIGFDELAKEIKLYNSNLHALSGQVDILIETTDDINSNVFKIKNIDNVGPLGVLPDQYVDNLESQIDNNLTNDISDQEEDYEESFEYKITNDFIKHIHHLVVTFKNYPEDNLYDVYGTTKVTSGNIFKLIRSLRKEYRDKPIKYITSTKRVNDFLDSISKDIDVYLYKSSDKEMCQWAIINGLYNIEAYNISNEDLS